MVDEGIAKCSHCNKVHCRLCVTKEEGLCLPCLSSDRSTDPVASLTADDLRAALGDKQVEVTASISISELQEVYSNIVVDGALGFLESGLPTVSFPTKRMMAMSLRRKCESAPRYPSSVCKGC
jgi:hypothetical protein